VASTSWWPARPRFRRPRQRRRSRMPEVLHRHEQWQGGSGERGDHIDLGDPVNGWTLIFAFALGSPSSRGGTAGTARPARRSRSATPATRQPLPPTPSTLGAGCGKPCTESAAISSIAARAPRTVPTDALDLCGCVADVVQGHRRRRRRHRSVSTAIGVRGRGSAGRGGQSGRRRRRSGGVRWIVGRAAARRLRRWRRRSLQ
jgi:hypothetical protein